MLPPIRRALRPLTSDGLFQGKNYYLSLGLGYLRFLIVKLEKMTEFTIERSLSKKEKQKKSNSFLRKELVIEIVIEFGHDFSITGLASFCTFFEHLI